MRKSSPDGSPFLRLPADEDDSFDADGNLTGELQVAWRGNASEAQVAFAANGLVLVIPLVQDEGVATLLPENTEGRDVQRILQAFVALRARGYVAEGALAWASTDGWQAVTARGNGSRAVFWTTQNHEDCFDQDSDLLLPLPLQWAGDKQELATALATTGLGVKMPDSDDTVLYLVPRADGDQTGSSMLSGVEVSAVASGCRGAGA
jgi:hypothetical protein